MNEKYLERLEFDKIRAQTLDLLTCPESAALLTSQCPGISVEQVRELLAQTDAVTTLLLKNGAPRFSCVKNASVILQRALKGGILSMGELLEIACTLRNFRELLHWYHLTEHGALCIDEYFYAMVPQPALEQSITQAILSDTEMADTASEALYDIRRKIRAAENAIRDRLDNITHTQSYAAYLQESVVSIRNGRFVVPVKAEYRAEINGMIHDVSASGATLFVEPTGVVEENAKILQLRSQEQAEIERLLSVYSAQCAALEPMFSLGYQAMLQVDILLGKAQLALQQNAMCPIVSENCSFSLVRARHPLIAPSAAVPIDIALGAGYDTLVVTGPNTGGKTVTLKTAGLLCAMASYGYLIPAHETSRICVFEQILVDIGDEQSIEQSLSTFSGHLRSISEILALAAPQTLVLMDELGSGTDPAEGAALAIALLEELRSKGAYIMATTHYSELKTFALETPGVQNASCEFDLETLRPTYRLNIGVPGKSNAFSISRRLGIAPHIIDRAQGHLSEENRRLDAVLAQLEELKLQLQQREHEAEELKNSAREAAELARTEHERLIQQAKTELAAARERARHTAQEVQSQAYHLMNELRKLEKSEHLSTQQKAARVREIAKKDSESLFSYASSIHDNTSNSFTPLQSVQIGQEVYVADLEKTAIVTAKPDRDGLVAVRAGILKTKVPLQRLSAPKKQVPAAKKQSKYTPRSASRSTGLHERITRHANMEINLLGMTVEEALMEADRFIDGGIMSGQSTLYLIHGKGTGALRKAIHAHLRRHPNVKSYRLGVYGEGEDGVTVIELR